MSMSIAYRLGMDYSDLKIRSRRGDSNSRPAVYETAALPLSYVGSRPRSLPAGQPVRPQRTSRFHRKWRRVTESDPSPNSIAECNHVC